MKIVEKNESENEEPQEAQENDRQDQGNDVEEVQHDNLLKDVKEELSAGLKNQQEEFFFVEEGKELLEVFQYFNFNNSRE